MAESSKSIMLRPPHAVRKAVVRFPRLKKAARNGAVALAFTFASLLPLKESHAQSPVEQIVWAHKFEEHSGLQAGLDFRGSPSYRFRLLSSNENLDTFPKSQLYALNLNPDGVPHYPSVGRISRARLYLCLGAESAVRITSQPLISFNSLYLDDKFILFEINSRMVYDTIGSPGHLVDLPKLNTTDIYTDADGEMRKRNQVWSMTVSEVVATTIVVGGILIVGVFLPFYLTFFVEDRGGGSPYQPPSPYSGYSQFHEIERIRNLRKGPVMSPTNNNV